MDDKVLELFSEYVVETWFSKEDKSYLARIQEIPDCIADGETREEAIQELELIFSGWYEIALEDHKEIPKPNRKVA